MVGVDAEEDWGATGAAYLTGDPAGPADFSRAAPVIERRVGARSVPRGPLGQLVVEMSSM